MTGLALVATALPGRLVAQQRPVAAGDAPVPAARALDDLLRRPVTISVTHVTRNRAIDAAAVSARVLVQYQTDVLDTYRDLVTLHLKGVPLREVLDRVLAGTNLHVVLDGPAQLAVVAQGQASSRPVAQGTGVIMGRVTDSANGQGLDGAAVRVQGMQASVVTTDSGRFVLRNVPVGDQVLTVRLFGHRPVTRTVTVPENGETTVRVAMAATATVLSGVVTTATGTQRKLEVGSDIAVLNVDSLRQVAPITSVADLLEARVPGVTVQRTSGIPGAPARVRLRGVGSISQNNDPIVVVDGVRVYAQQSDPRNTNTLGRLVSPSAQTPDTYYTVPSPLDQIDPNSIETLEVLRGPSASAMYGSDAGNGVIVITTKRGRAGPTHVSATLGHGLSFQPGQFPVGLYRFGHDYNKPTTFCALADPFCTLDSVVAFQALNVPQLAVTTAHGTTQELSGLVSGGVGALTYALNGSYGHQTGQLQLPGLEVERFTTFHGFAPPRWMRHPDQYTTAGGGSRLDLPLTAGSRSGTASLTSSVFKSDQQQSSLQTAIAKLMGTYIDTTQLGATTILPEFYERATNGSMNVTNAVTLTWPVASWLPLTATAGANLMTTTQQTLTPRDYVLGTVDSAGHFGVNHGSTATYTLNVNTTMPSRWAHTAVGFNFANNATNNLSAQVTGLPLGVTNPTSFTGLVAGQNAGTSSQASVATSTYGWFVAPTLNLHSRFFVTPGLRLDGGSASGGRVSTSIGGQSIRGVSGFPKMDFSWLAVDPSGEGTRRGIGSAVSLLRLRGAFGAAGRQPDPAGQLRLFTAGVVPAIGTQPGMDIVHLSTLGNTLLRPERSRELEYGLDAELWRGRLTLGVTGARKTTQDALLAVTLPPSLAGDWGIDGVETLSSVVQQNIGATRNTDLELTARATVLQRAAVTWDVGGTITHSSSLVVRLDPSVANLEIGGSQVSGVIDRIVAGYPINGLWAKPIVGYGDTNGDGIIQTSEVLVGDSLRYLGQPLPTYEATVNTDVALFGGRLTAHTALAYQHGMTQYNAAAFQRGNVCNSGSAACTSVGTVLFGNDPTAPLGQQAAFAALALSGNNRTAYGLVQTVSALRWQSLSINYVAPHAVARLVRARQLMLVLQGNNLGLHTNYHGKDPNVNVFSSGDLVQDAGQLPLPRTFTLKLTLGN